MLLTASISAFVEIANLLIDKIVSGQMLGEQALSSVALVTPLFSFVFFIGVVIAVGSTVCYIYEIGKVNYNRASCFFGQGVILAFLAGLFLAVGFAVFKTQVFYLLNVPENLLYLVGSFYKWFIVVAFLVPINNLLQEMIFVDGDTKVCNLSYAVLTLGNMLASFILVQVVGMEGVAMGTVIGFILSIAVLMTHFFKEKNTLKFKWHLKIRDCGLVVWLSLVEACDYLYFAVFSFVMTQMFLYYHWNDNLSVLSMMFEVWECGVIFTGIWLAADPLINVYRGERNALRIKRLMLFVNKAVFKEGALAMVGFFVFAPLIVKVFHFNSVESIDNAVHAIRMASVGMLAYAIVKVYANYYVHEWPIFAVAVVSFSAFLAPLVCCFALGSVIGVNGVWLGMGIAPILALACGVAIFVLKFGFSNLPLNLKNLNNTHKYVMDLILNPKNIVKQRDKMEKILIRENVNAKTRMKIMLFVEEIGMIFYERCKGYKIYAEYDVTVGEDFVECVMKDEGPYMDLTKADVKISDLRMYLVNSLMVNHDDKTYILTTSYNRHVFRFPR